MPKYCVNPDFYTGYHMPICHNTCLEDIGELTNVKEG